MLSWDTTELAASKAHDGTKLGQARGPICVHHVAAATLGALSITSSLTVSKTLLYLTLYGDELSNQR